MANTPIPPLGSPSAAEDVFQIYTSPGDVRFLSKAVQPPSVVYVENSDDLTVTCATTVNLESVVVTYRLLRADGEVILGQIQVSPPNTRAVVSQSQSLAEGFLLTVSCKAAAATSRGQTFVRVFLSDPAAGPSVPTYMLMADYVTTAMAPAYPGGRVLSPTEGPGAIVLYVIGTPALGHEWSKVVPANTRWKILGVDSTFATSAAVPARLASVCFAMPLGFAVRCFATATQAAGITAIYNASDAGPQLPATTIRQHIALPDNGIIETAGSIQSLTDNLDTNDAYVGPSIMVEEWLLNV